MTKPNPATSHHHDQTAGGAEIDSAATVSVVTGDGRDSTTGAAAGGNGDGVALAVGLGVTLGAGVGVLARERVALGEGEGDGVARGRPDGVADGNGTGVAAVADGRGVGAAVATGAGERGCSIEKFSRPGSDWAAAGAIASNTTAIMHGKRKVGIGRFQQAIEKYTGLRIRSA